MSGTIVERRGPLSYRVELPDKRIVRCHQDHIRPGASSKEPCTSSDEFLVDIPVTTNLSTGLAPDHEVTPSSEVLNSEANSEPPALEPRYPTRVRHRPDYYGHTC